MSETTKSGLSFTGERFVPTEGGVRIAYEHYHRYFFAQQLARGKIVLDLGCGEGYGSHLLAAVAERVTGMDLSPETVEHARSRYRRSNLSFVVGDCRDTGLPDRQFEFIVCFEMMEHIAEHDQLLAEVKRLLKPEGTFLVSSPDKRFYSDAEGYENPFHVKELYAQEFQALLEKHFTHVITYSQRVCSGSLLVRTPAGGADHGAFAELIEVEALLDGTFIPADLKSGEAKYLIGVCSTAPIGGHVRNLALSLWNDRSEAMLRESEETYRELQSQVEHLNEENLILKETVGGRERAIAERDRALEEKVLELSRLNRALSEKDRSLTDKDNQIIAGSQQINGLEQTVQALREFEKKVKESLAWKVYYSLLRPLRRLFR